MGKDINVDALDQQGRLQTYFHYTPNEPLALISLILFFLIAFPMGYKNLKYPSRFLWILVGATLAECISYIAREIAIHNVTKVTYIIMLLFVLLTPNAIALVNYMAVGKICTYAEFTSTWFKPYYIPRFFFIADIFCFAIQGFAGGLLASNNTDSMKLGADVFTVGVILQLVFIGAFCFVTYWCDRKLKREQPDKHQLCQKAFITLYVTILLLTIRTIYRTVEYKTGYDGVVATTEWIYYAFDTLPIFICFMFYTWLHLGQYLPVECLNASSGGKAKTSTGINSSMSMQEPAVELKTIQVESSDSQRNRAA